MTTYEATIQNIEKAIEHLDGILAQKPAWSKASLVWATRDHFMFAAAFLRRDMLDRAGPHLEAAQRLLKEVQA